MTFSMGHETREQRARKEMVQVAAVAASILEQSRYGTTDFHKAWQPGITGPKQGDLVLSEIREERLRQDEKWGAGRSHTEVEYAMILAEEIGEWVAELDHPWTGGKYNVAAGVLQNLYAAGVQARAWIEKHEWPDRQQEVIDAEAEEPAACSMCGHTRYLRICVDRSCLCRCYTADDEGEERRIGLTRKAVDYPEDGSYIVAEVDPQCLERWPECVDGAYDPQCCRWPKSCSCEVIR